MLIKTPYFNLFKHKNKLLFSFRINTIISIVYLYASEELKLFISMPLQVLNCKITTLISIIGQVDIIIFGKNLYF